MNFESLELIKNMMSSSDVISFDVFDTLLFRKVNSPEDVFVVMEQYLHIPGLCELRKRAQNRANATVVSKFGYPHANIDEIYEEMSQMEGIVDTGDIKEAELKIEEDSIAVNSDIEELYEYACSLNKKIIAVTDMYLTADFILALLHKKGLDRIEKVYCSANERATKWHGNLYKVISQKENVEFEEITHIGDNQKSDVDIPKNMGINAFLYKKLGYDKDKFISSSETIIDNGMRKILCNPRKSFWYNFGIETGGPLYMGLLQWFCDKNPDKNAHIFLLSRDGYNLYKLLKKLGYRNAKYLYASRRALLLAGITDMNDEDIALLPPFTVGQTVREVLEYLSVNVEDIRHLREAGFDSFDDKIKSYDDGAKFKKLYKLDKVAFLKRVLYERENAKAYFTKEGVFEEDAVMFDCGWAGSSQFLFERFLNAANIKSHNKFFYFGITNTVRSRTQLSGVDYDKYLDDNCINDSVLKHEALFELLFSAPHEALLCYENYGPQFEKGTLIPGKDDIEEAVTDYIEMAYDYAQKYNILYDNDNSIGHLKHIIFEPTEHETQIIGDLNNVNSYKDVRGQKKRMAFITEEEYEVDRNVSILWPEGFMRRKDVDYELKKRVAKDRGYKFPNGEDVVYNLEGLYNLENYCYYRTNCRSASPNRDILSNGPHFSIIMPVYNTVSYQLCAAVESVLNQTYDKYELILVDDNSTWDNVIRDLKKYESNEHVKLIFRNTNGGISECTNTGINAATGEYIVFMDCDDLIDGDALYEFAMTIQSHPEYEYIYCDQDKVTEDGLIYHSPFFKPDWSPDLYISECYSNHLSVHKADVVKKIGGLKSEYDGAQDYDFIFRFVEEVGHNHVGHIPRILYHWRERKESIAYSIETKLYALNAVERLKEDDLKRRGIKGHIEYVPAVKQHRVVYEVMGRPLVSLIIYGEEQDAIKDCEKYVRAHTTYGNYEVIEVYGRKEYGKKIFDAAEEAKGDYLVFLDSNIEVLKSNWLNILLAQAQQAKCGAVGAKILYKDTPYIRHCGISIVEKNVVRDFERLDDSKSYAYGFNIIDRNCTAVSLECLCVSKRKYDAVGGFDTELVTYLDVDLCLALLTDGLYNVIRNDVVLAYDADSHEPLEYKNDLERLLQKYPEYFAHDHFINCNLKCYGEHLEYRDFPTDSVRVSGYSSIDGIDCRLSERRLLITDSRGSTAYADVTDVPRIDVLKKYDYDKNHLWDGFVLWINKSVTDTLWDNLDNCTFSIEGKDDKGNKYTAEVILDDEDSMEADNRKIKEFAEKYSKIFVYGAGTYGRECYNRLRTQGVEVNAFLVSKNGSNQENLFGISVEELDSVKEMDDKNNVGIFVALKPIFRSEVLPLLEENGFDNVITYPFDIF